MAMAQYCGRLTSLLNKLQYFELNCGILQCSMANILKQNFATWKTFPMQFLVQWYLKMNRSWSINWKIIIQLPHMKQRFNHSLKNLLFITFLFSPSPYTYISPFTSLSDSSSALLHPLLLLLSPTSDLHHENRWLAPTRTIRRILRAMNKTKPLKN